MNACVLNLDPIAARDVTTLVARGVLAAGRLTPRGAVVYELRDVDAFETWAAGFDNERDWDDLQKQGQACFDGECESAEDEKSAKEIISNARKALKALAAAVEGLKSVTARRQLAAAMTELEGALS